MLVNALRLKREDLAKRLLSLGHSESNVKWWTSVNNGELFCSEEGLYEYINILLDAGHRDNEAVYWAVDHAPGYLECLLLAGLKNNDALERAVVYERTEQVKQLINTGHAHEGAIYWAARHGRADYLKLMIDSGHEPECVGQIVWGAVENGHTECLRVLLDAGYKKHFSLSPTVQYNRPKCLELLLKSGIRADSELSFKRLVESAEYKGYTECVTLLKLYGHKD